MRHTVAILYRSDMPDNLADLTIPGALLRLYDRQQRPISFMEWGELKLDEEYSVLAFDEFDGFAVSTVWIGDDASYGRAQIPLIFETMIFGERHPWDLDRWKYATEQQAMRSHPEIVECALLRWNQIQATHRPRFVGAMGNGAMREVRQQKREVPWDLLGPVGEYLCGHKHSQRGAKLCQPFNPPRLPEK